MKVKKVIQLNRNGMAKVTFSFCGRYEDTVSLASYKIEVTDTGVTITDMKL